MKKIFTTLLTIVCLLNCNVFLVKASDEITLSLNNLKDTTRFECTNMLPGDVNTKTYKVNVAHKDSVTVNFGIEIKTDTNDLSDFLSVTIKDANGNILVNNKNIKDVETFGVEVAKGVESIEYQISVYFDENFDNDDLAAFEGNEAKVTANFNWDIQKEDEGQMLAVDTSTKGTRATSFEPFILILIVTALIVLFFVLLQRKTIKSKVTRIIVLVVLATLICGNTTYALYLAKLNVYDNLFTVKKYNIDIDINDGDAAIDTTEINELFEPGRSRLCELKLQNKGDVDMYYRLYLSDVEGELLKTINIQIYSDKKCNNLLYEIRGTEFDKEHAFFNKDIIEHNSNKSLYLVLKMDEEAGNEYQDASSSFTIECEAIQSTNNSEGFK